MEVYCYKRTAEKLFSDMQNTNEKCDTAATLEYIVSHSY